MGMHGFAALGCACASLLFSIISIALPYWLYAERSYQAATYKAYIGLWRSCSDLTILGQTKSNCVTFGDDDVADFLKATRAFEIIGLLLVAGSGIIGFLKLVVMKENANLPNIAGCLAIAAGVCIIIGTCIYGVKAQNEQIESKLHAGFALAVVSGGISIAAGCFFFASKSS